MIYSNGYLYIFGGISVWPRGGVHEARQSFCIAKMLDDTGKRWEWVRRDAPIPAKVPQLGYSVNAYLVCNESKILLVPGLTSEDTVSRSIDSLMPTFGQLHLTIGIWYLARSIISKKELHFVRLMRVVLFHSVQPTRLSSSKSIELHGFLHQNKGSAI